MCQQPAVLKGRDDQGVCKSGYLWKRTTGSFRKWKPYFVVVSRLCLLCFKCEEGLLDGSGLKVKIELHSLTDITQGGRRRRVVVCSVQGLLHLRLKCSTEEEASEWLSVLRKSSELCRKRRQVLAELQRASFMRNVECNLKVKMRLSHPEILSTVPRVTFLRRVSSCDSLIPEETTSGLRNNQRSFSLEEDAFLPLKKYQASPHTKKRNWVSKPPIRFEDQLSRPHLTSSLHVVPSHLNQQTRKLMRWLIEPWEEAYSQGRIRRCRVMKSIQEDEGGEEGRSCSSEESGYEDT